MSAADVWCSAPLPSPVAAEVPSEFTSALLDNLWVADDVWCSVLRRAAVEDCVLGLTPVVLEGRRRAAVLEVWAESLSLDLLWWLVRCGPLSDDEWLSVIGPLMALCADPGSPSVSTLPLRVDRWWFGPQSLVSQLVFAGFVPHRFRRELTSVLWCEDRLAVLCSEFARASSARTATHSRGVVSGRWQARFGSSRVVVTDVDVADAEFVVGSTGPRCSSPEDVLVPAALFAARPGLGVAVVGRVLDLFVEQCHRLSSGSRSGAAPESWLVLAISAAPWRFSPVFLDRLCEAVTSLTAVAQTGAPRDVLASVCSTPVVPSRLRSAAREVLGAPGRGVVRGFPKELSLLWSRRGHPAASTALLLSSGVRRDRSSVLSDRLRYLLPCDAASPLVPPLVPGCPEELVECCGSDPMLWRVALSLLSSPMPVADLVELVSVCR